MSNIANLKPFTKGDSRIRPKPKGATHFKTDFKLACKEVAKALRLGEEPDKIKIELIKRGIQKGLAGEYPFWRDLMDRIYEVDGGRITAFQSEQPMGKVEFVVWEKNK